MEKEVKVQENKMGVMPVAKLLLTMSVPMMISMLVQALYNIVDSMFVAKLSECTYCSFACISGAEPDDRSWNRYWCWYQCAGVALSWGEKAGVCQQCCK